MMKKLLMLLLFVIMATGIKAQTFAEWFQQKKTQKKYLLEQLAALQMYRGYVKKGYAIAREGLTTISHSKEGEFDLHQQFFGSLNRINPKIRNHAKVADMIALQVKIMQVYKNTYRQVQESDAFHADEVSYVYEVFGRLLDDCSTTLNVLLTITTSDKLEMKDDERLKYIEALYNDMQDKYTFVQSFSQETMMLAAVRLQEKKDMQTSRAMHGIKQEQL